MSEILKATPFMPFCSWEMAMTLTLEERIRLSSSSSMATFFKSLLRGILLFSMASMHCMAFGETIDEAVKRQLEIIRAYNSGQTDVIASPKDTARDMQATTSELINGVYRMEAADGSNPSPQRQALIDRFASLIAPYNNDLLKIGFSRDPALSELAHQCRSLLDHTKPDESFVAELRTHLPDFTKEAGYAYDLLFQHRQLTATEKSDLGRKVLAEPDRESRIRWAMKASAMLIPEVVPVLREMLSVPFNADGTTGSTGVFGENEALSNCRKAIEAINSLGPLAVSVLPLLKARLNEIEAMLPSEQAHIYSLQFRSAIEQVQGRRPLLIPTAINGSGPLVAGSPPQNNPQPAAMPVPVTPSSMPIRSATPEPPKPAPLVAESLAPVVERKSRVWPWLVGIAALTVIALLVWNRRA
jgi:hypothetical protein